MGSKVTTIKEVLKLRFDEIETDQFWNTANEKELKIHRIHAYPAKFPAFITDKALEYAQKNDRELERIADIFCGCGTVAYEAKRRNIDFWGCDINPVATLIAKTKSQNYSIKKLRSYYEEIILSYNKLGSISGIYESANERLKYWYSEREYNDLTRLKRAIEETISSKSSYRMFFLCAFSNILKATSRWLTKSIKPQVDPEKVPANVMRAFEAQCLYMIAAYEESAVKGNTKAEVVTGNFLDMKLERIKSDMVITSPPYVTSYEYADLHQLSTLWLEYTSDYRELRSGSVGSLYHIYNFESELKKLNKTGSEIVAKLIDKDKSQARSVAKYYLDMQRVAQRCQSMLNEKGLVLFIIGDTEYKGVRIENARHISEALIQNGFEEVIITKRKISGKILTPYRDKRGRFTTDCTSRKVYNEEYIVIGKK